MKLRAVLPIAALLATGCVATSSDIQVLQNDLSVMRAESARADSGRRQQIDQMLSSLRSTNDSIATLSARVARLRSDFSSSVETIDKQLIAIEELTGQSQRKLQELRATLDARPATNPTETSSSTTPGPNQLLDLAQSQMAAGSNATARTALQDLLTNYPTADVAPDALYYIAETYAAEGNTASADSVYALVVTRYPDSPHAATALYKRGVAAQTAGRASQARALFNEIIRKYPQAPEAALAKDRLNNRR
jgi:Uncharacterized protein conserved in bacteria